MPAPMASVLIPTHNPGRQIEHVLNAVLAQDAPFEFEVVIVDSASRPDDVATMRALPVAFHQISKHEFGHGRTRNHLAQLARGEFLLYLSQDAEPASRDWLRLLVDPLNQSGVAGVYAQQIPRDDADPLIRFFLARTYGPRHARRRPVSGRAARIDDIFFSNVSSAIRRSIWQRIPFRDDIIMSEDQYWAYDVLNAGYEVVYQPAAQVFHSHNYSLKTLFHRNWQSGASLRGLIADGTLGMIRRAMEYNAGQAAYLARSGRLHWLPYMLVYEATKAVAFSMGMRFGQQRT
jgi:rhamnosyltransferase